VGSSGAVHAFEAQRVLSQLVCSNAATNQVRGSRVVVVVVVVVAVMTVELVRDGCVHDARAGDQRALHQQGAGRGQGRDCCA